MSLHPSKFHSQIISLLLLLLNLTANLKNPLIILHISKAAELISQISCYVMFLILIQVHWLFVCTLSPTKIHRPEIF